MIVRQTVSLSKQADMNFNEIKELEDTYQLATYKKMNVAVERGEGAWI